MKKLVLCLAAIFLLGGLAFGQITVTGWGRGIFAAAMSAGGDLQTTTIASWGAAPRLSFTIAGKSPSAGFQIDIDADPEVLSSGNIAWLGDRQMIWIKPIPQLTLTIGRLYDDTVRGSADYGEWDWIRVAGMANGDDYVFTRVCQTNIDYMESNFEISLAPVDGLYMYGSLNGLLTTNANLSNALMLGQYGAGYTIQGVGLIRAQYQGITTQYGLVNAAFRLTAVQGLMVDIGAYIPIVSSLAGYYANIPLFATLDVDPAKIFLNGRVQLQTTGDVGWEAGLGANLTLDKTSGLGLTGDVRYQNSVLSSTVGPTYPNGVLSFLIGFTFSFSNGMCGIGFQGTTGNFVNGLTKTDISALAWAVPIRLEYFF